MNVVPIPDEVKVRYPGLVPVPWKFIRSIALGIPSDYIFYLIECQYKGQDFIVDAKLNERWLIENIACGLGNDFTCENEVDFKYIAHNMMMYSFRMI